MPQLGLDVQLIHLDQGHNYSLAVIKAERLGPGFIRGLLKFISQVVL